MNWVGNQLNYLDEVEDDVKEGKVIVNELISQ